MTDTQRRARTGRGLTLVGAVLGLVVAVALGALPIVGGSLPDPRLPMLAYSVFYAMPSLLALLSLHHRPSLIVPAATLSFLLAFTAFWLAFPLLVPFILFGFAYELRRTRPLTTIGGLLAVILPVLACVGAFAALLVGDDSVCYRYRDDPDGARSYTEVACAEGGRLEPEVRAGPDGSREFRTGGASTVTPFAAGASIALVAAGLAAGWALSGSGSQNGGITTPSCDQNGVSRWAPEMTGQAVRRRRPGPRPPARR